MFCLCCGYCFLFCDKKSIKWVVKSALVEKRFLLISGTQPIVLYEASFEGGLICSAIYIIKSKLIFKVRK